MKDILEISDALKYLCIGYVSLGLYYICDKVDALELINGIGIIGISVFAFVIGSQIFLIYKPILYHYIVMPLQDFARIDSDNYRTYLKKKYEIDTQQSMVFWIYLGQRFKDQQPALQQTFSGIHLMYMSGFISLSFAIWQCISNQFEMAGIILVLAIVFWISAFVYDIHVESVECLLLRSIKNEELDEIAGKFSFKKKENNNK